MSIGAALLLLVGGLPCAADPVAGWAAPMRPPMFALARGHAAGPRRRTLRISRPSTAWLPGRSASLLARAHDLEPQPANYRVTKVNAIPHEDTPWTQGLEMDDSGQLVETSGDYPPGVGSLIRLVNKSSGEVTRKVTGGLNSPMFVEGICLSRGRWFASTYEDYKAIEYDQDFDFVREHPYPWQGWGLARSPDGQHFIATNGSEWVMTLASDTFELLSEKVATCQGSRVRGLNELEMVDDFLGEGPRLLANVINTRIIVILDPATAKCTGAFHLKDLEPIRPGEEGGMHVANGIAYDAASRHLFVTGKNWENIFEISLERADASESDGADALSMLSRVA